MSPRIIDNFHINVVVSLHHPLNNQFFCRRFCHRNAYSWIQHPILPIHMNDYLQWSVDFNINRLTKWGTFTNGVLNVHTKLLDWADHWWYHAASVWIQHKQWNNISWFCCDEWFTNFLIHSNIPTSSIPAFSWQQYSQPDGKLETLLQNSYHFVYLWASTLEATFPPTHTVTARVANLVSCVEVCLLTDLTSFISKVCLEWEVKKTGVYQYL